MPDTVVDKDLVVHVQRQVRRVSVAANMIGALTVFVLVAFVLPLPRSVQHDWSLLALNGGMLAATAASGVPLGIFILQRLWHTQTEWVMEGREATARERELTLRFPLTQQLLVGLLWMLDAAVFAIVNVFFSPLLALSIAITVVLGGLVTSALGYLLCERQLRPIFAMALASGVPDKPQLPGVAARTVLSWTLGAGATLLGLTLVGVAALVIDTFTIRRLAIVVIVLGATGLAVGWAVMLGLARSLAHPIENLRAALGQVQEGNFDVDVTVDDGSEVGLLQAGFNRMVAGLREREEIRDLFGRQVGEDVVRHALEHGVELGGEARDAAVLFVDLMGSTRLAAERDPTEVVSLLNRFFAIVVEVVHEHDGWVNKFEGDAALCVFGAPLADDACVCNALAAGRLLAARLCRELPDLTAGVGISAGRVVAGNLGAARRFEYTVIGDPVNEAARLSDLAKSEDGRVLAAKTAVDQAGDEASHWEVAREEKLRGRPEPTVVAVPRREGAASSQDGDDAAEQDGGASEQEDGASEQEDGATEQRRGAAAA